MRTLMWTWVTATQRHRGAWAWLFRDDRRLAGTLTCRRG